MNPTASTVGAYLRDLPPDRRVAMARLCSMIRRSARGVRESMRYGLAFYELDGPLFALESGRRHMSLYVAEKDVVLKHKDALQGVNANKSFIKFSDLNRLPLDVVEKIVRDSVAARRQRLSQGTVPTQAELLKLWGINEEAAAPPATTVKLPGRQAGCLDDRRDQCDGEHGARRDDRGDRHRHRCTPAPTKPKSRSASRRRPQRDGARRKAHARPAQQPARRRALATRRRRQPPRRRHRRRR